jgi:hypothetical protein
MSKERKKLKDTKVGAWLKDKAPQVLDTVGELLPDQGALGVVKRLLDKEDLPKEDRLEFEKLMLEQERHAQDNVTERWTADMSSDSKLAKNVRPIALIALLGLYLLLAITDSIESIKFEVKEEYVSLLEVLALTAFSAYFAGRSIEKVQYKRKT